MYGNPRSLNTPATRRPLNLTLDMCGIDHDG
jgi:hypothetical protein